MAGVIGIDGRGAGQTSGQLLLSASRRRRLSVVAAPGVAGSSKVRSLCRSRT